MGSATQIPTLPPVAHKRIPRKSKLSAPYHSYSFLELLKYYTGLDQDLIWGPFYQGVRAARRERTNWDGFTLSAMWDGIPDTAQKRPGNIRRFLNWIACKDPAPTLTPPSDVESDKRTRRPRASKDSKTRESADYWEQETGMIDDWSPAQIDFTEWYGRFKHPVDYDDDFYRDNYQALYHRVCDLAETWFGAGVYLEDLQDGEEKVSTWEVPMTEQFIQYARIVAHEDRGHVDWKDIMNDPRHRKWLCVGIISQIIERKIFNELLFGAGDEFRKELERHDEQWILQEGFTRKDGRRQIARCAVGGGLIPENFWDAVDDLAGQTALIFQPLLMLVSLGAGGTGGDEAAFWQEIHSVLALAGYFQVCMAVSPSIFHILSASPGSRFQWEEEAHADSTIYQRSKEFHKSHEDRWRVIADFSSKNDDDAVNALVDAIENDGDDTSMYEPLPTNDDEYRVMDHKRRRGGKVMYAVFPKLTRYTAENVGNIIPDMRRWSPHAIQTAGEGTRISILSRCMVVYYQGLVHASSDQDDGVPLEDYLGQISWKRMFWKIFPYWEYYWDHNGDPAVWLHWPVWPEVIDDYWLYSASTIVFALIVRYKLAQHSVLNQRFPDRPFVYRLIIWVLMEMAVYLVARAYNWSFFQGRGLMLQAKIFVILFMVVFSIVTKARHGNEERLLFSYLTAPFIWADKILLNMLPDFVMNLVDAVENEGATTIISRLFSSNNATVVGR
ncbi:hypothetical protein F5Y09DRAFT_352318 [Xylaria sp. FL1042]|nr:hypothetical protein F5Y09DRAFT_352318 [Xylaria sp. FL1042]